MAGDVRFVRLQYDGGARRRVKRNPCKALWQGAKLRWNGEINACGYDFHSRYTLGDIKKDSFARIWSGEEYTRMRKQFREDWNGISICENCTYAFEGGNYDEVIAETVFLKPEASVHY